MGVVTLTPGAELSKRWCAQVDTTAFYLKKLQDARVPILWRPYHEMNGDWFWWGAVLGNTAPGHFTDKCSIGL
jgi:mannan endo-1,4-beta-mannosidase